MPYLNLDLDYFTHPKTMRLVSLLGKGAEILPIKLWCAAGKYHAESGRFTGYLPQEIEAIVGWWGDQGEFLKAMVHVGFLREIADGWELHEWLDHEGHLVMFKERAKRAAQVRWGCNKHATSNAKDLPKQCPLPTKPYQTKPKTPPKSPLGDGESSAVPKPRTDLQRIVEGWKILTGIDREDKAWDRVHFARCAKSANSLLTLFGSVDAALDCMEHVYNWAQAKKLDCTIETIVKRSDLFKEVLAGRGIR